MALGNRFASLPARPPTPPKDLFGSEHAFIQTCGTLDSSPLNTPETPLVLSPGYFTSKISGQGTKRKRVNFALASASDVHDLTSSPSLPTISPDRARHPLHLRNQNARSRPFKSILKASRYGLLSDGSLDSDDAFQFDFTSPLTFKDEKINMVDGVFSHLTSSDKSIRLGAYQSLFTAIRTNTDIIKLVEFRNRLPSLVAAIHRDLRNAGGSDHRDGQLAVEALKIANTLVWKNVLSEEAVGALLDWCTHCLDQPGTSKNLVSNVLLFMSCIKSNRVFSAVRATKVFEKLKTLEVRVKGKQIQILRLDIYRRMIAQKQPCMIANAEVWLRQLLDGLLREQKEIVQHALDLGRVAGITYGSKKEVSVALMLVLRQQASPSSRVERANEANDEGSVRQYQSFFISSVVNLIDDKSTAVRVPQIWSIIIMLLRHQSANFRSWENWSQWLSLLQRCFNSGDANIKSLANSAWRDLIWSSQDDILKDSSIRKSLLRPVLGQLERVEKERPKAEVELTYCTLLYYTMRPGINMEQMTTVWEEYVEKTLLSKAGTNSANRCFALRVLASLLGGTEQKVWDRDRALQSQDLDHESLLRLDPLWIRANIERVLQVAEQHIACKTMEPAAQVIELQLQAWNCLVTSIAEIGRREVRPTSLATRSVAALVSCAMRLNRALEEDTTYGGLMASLLDIIVRTSPALPLSQKLFHVGSHGIFAVENGKGNQNSSVALTSAIDAIIDVYTVSNASQAVVIASTEQVMRAVDVKLKTFTSRSSLIVGIADLSTALVIDSNGEHPRERDVKMSIETEIWRKLLARFLEAFEEVPESISGSRQAGADFRSAVSVLTSGLAFAHKVHRELTASLHALASNASQAAGSCGLITALLSPFAYQLLHMHALTSFDDLCQELQEIFSTTLDLIPQINAGDDLAISGKRLWGSSAARYDNTNHPYRPVYDLLSLVLASENPMWISNAANAWNRLQAGTEELQIPSELFLGLMRASRVLEIATRKIGKDSVAEGPLASLPTSMPKIPEKNNSQEEEIHHDDKLCSLNSPRVSMLPFDQPTPHNSDISMLLDRSDSIDEMPSSPPDVHPLVTSPSPSKRSKHTLFRASSNAEAPSRSVPLSDEIDHSPTPVRHFSQIRINSVQATRSSPQPVRRLHFQSDSITKDDQNPFTTTLLSSTNEQKRAQWQPADKSVPGRVAPEGAVRRSSSISAVAMSPPKTRAYTRKANMRAKGEGTSKEPGYRTGETESSPVETTRSRATRPRLQRSRPEQSLAQPVEPKRSRGRPPKSARSSLNTVHKTTDNSDMEDCIIIGSSPHGNSKGNVTTNVESVKPRPEAITDSNLLHDLPVTPSSHPTRQLGSHSSGTSGKRRRMSAVSLQLQLESEAGAERQLNSKESNRNSENRCPSGLNKRQKLSETTHAVPVPNDKVPGVLGSSGAAISATAQGFIARLKDLVNEMQRTVLRWPEARDILRTVSELNTATIDAEERGEAHQPVRQTP